MIPMPGLTAAELLALHADMILGPYLARPSVQLLTLDHGHVADLSDRVTDGQIDCKLEAKVASRSATITVVDPKHTIAIDGASAGDGALFYDKQIQIGIEFKGPRLGRWVTIPLFCGPITNAERGDWTASITAQGKERLATGMVWTPRTYHKGAKRTDVVRDLLVQAGEHPARVLAPDLPGTLPKPLALLPEDNAWVAVRGVLDSANRQGLYDGRGDFRVRTWPTDPKVVFRGGDGGSMLSKPKITYPESTSWNGAWAVGPKLPNGKRPEWVTWLPKAHQLSPWSRVRNGVPFRMAYKIDAPNVRTNLEAREVSDRYLLKLVREIVNVEVEVMPNWLIEPGDVVGFIHRDIGYVEQVLSEFSMPVMAGVSMTLGAVKPVPRPVQKIRKAPKRHHHKAA